MKKPWTQWKCQQLGNHPEYIGYVKILEDIYKEITANIHM